MATKFSEFFKPDGSNWCQEAMCLNEFGHPCPLVTGNPVKFCLLGGLVKFCHDNKIDRKTLSEKVFPLVDDNITMWNDHPGRTVQEVIEVCKRAEEGEE